MWIAWALLAIVANLVVGAFVCSSINERIGGDLLRWIREFPAPLNIGHLIVTSLWPVVLIMYVRAARHA